MSSGNSRKTVSLFIHILSWSLLGFVLMFYQPLSWGVKLPLVFWIKQSLHLAALIVLFYFNSLYLVPRFLLRNRIWYYILWIVAICVVMLVLSRYLEDALNIWEEMSKATNRPRPGKHNGIDGFLLMTILLSFGISTSFRVVQRWQRVAVEHEELEKRQIASELSFLKSQINPHFFFNTLNNIYALSYTDVPLSRDALLKLSRMMRYLLYETQNNSALLSKEISFLKDYIELMKLRLHKTISVNFQDKTGEHDVVIAPMLLLPFIENAFKHGISLVEEAKLDILIELTGSVLSLQVRNTIFREPNSLEADGGGIGLANTRRRLELLYSDRYLLDIKDNPEENYYLVALTIDLS